MKPESNSSSPLSTLFIVSCVQFLVPFMMSAVGVALPTIGNYYNANAVSLGLVEMVYILALAMFLLPAGRIADIYGRKKIFLTGVCIFTFTTAILPLADSIHTFIFLRFFQGAGASLNISTSIAILSAVFPKEKRGRAMGVIVACVYLGLSAGPTLAGFMISHFGWKWIFFVAAPLGFSAFCLAAIRLKGEWRSSRGEPFDKVGSLIYMISLFCLISGISHLKEGNIPAILACFGVTGLLGFIYFEMNQQFPVLNIRLLIKNKVLAFSNLATWINYAASFGITFFFSLYLQIVKGMSPQSTGLILIIQPLIQACLSPVFGILADKYSAAKIATVGMGICAAGLGVAAFIGIDSPLFLLVVSLVVMGIGFAAFSTPNMTTIMGSVTPEHYGVASSLVATMRTFGMLTSMTLITFLLSFFMGDEHVSTQTIPEFIKTMKTGFMIFSVLSIGGIWCSMVRARPLKKIRTI